MSLKTKQSNNEKSPKLNESQNKKEKEEKVEIPIYHKLYPPIKDIFIYDEYNEINNNLLKIKSKLSTKKKNFLEEQDNEEMTEEFIKDLVKNPCPISRPRVIEMVSKFIQKSKLMEKLESEYQAEKKIGNESLSEICAERLAFQEFHPGEIIFKIGDTGDRFYFILSGSVAILKPKELPKINMTYIEYLQYCRFLIRQKEEYLLSEVIKRNDSVLNLTSIEEVNTIYKIVFMKKLTEYLNKSIINNNHLKIYFNQNGQKFEDYDIKIEELELMEQNKTKGILGAAKEWESYINKRCRLTVGEQVFFQPFESILKDNSPKKIICLCYDSFLYMGPGLFFGDTALDFEINKRNATIRAEEETVVAYLKRNDYLSIISPKHKQEKLKEMEFIYENFFFTSINSHIFEKNFFHLFSPREYYRGSILFSNGTIPRSLILLKSGRISLELKCSIIDIQNLIKFIYNNIFSNPLFAKLSQVKKNKYLPPEKISIIKNYINDPVLTRLKMHNSKFIEEMNVIRNYQIKILTTNETIGLEEIFLRLPYLMKATVINQKIYCFELGLEYIEKMLNSGKDVTHSYIKSSVNKIVSLIERLQNIKQNCINMSLVKYEKEMLQYKGWKKIDINLKNKNHQNTEKEENKFEKNRNSKINADKKRKNIEKEINNSNNLDNDNENENEKEGSAVIQYNNSSPVKAFMTNITPTSLSVFEQMNLAFEKIKKKQSKFRYNKINPSSTGSQNFILSSFNNSLLQKNENRHINSKKNISFFKTAEILKSSSFIPNMKEEPKLSSNNNSSFRNNSNNKINNICSDESQQLSQNGIIANYNNKNQINNIAKSTFSMSYVPLNLMCQNENNIDDNKNKHLISTMLSNRTNLDLYSLKRNSSSIFENKNCNNNISNNFNNDINKVAELKRRINIISKKYYGQNISKDKIKENEPNVINKHKLISGIIKDFYKEMRLNGYASLIRNKEINTVFMRKFNKKYESAEKISHNIKLNLLQRRSDSLPLIF